MDSDLDDTNSDPGVWFMNAGHTNSDDDQEQEQDGANVDVLDDDLESLSGDEVEEKDLAGASSIPYILRSYFRITSKIAHRIFGVALKCNVQAQAQAEEGQADEDSDDDEGDEDNDVERETMAQEIQEFEQVEADCAAGVYLPKHQR